MKSFSNQENFYKRLRELSNVDAPTRSKGLEHQTLVEYSRATDGSALGIIKEDSSFYIKSSTTGGDLSVEHFTYIGGLENKLKYKYDTLAEAVKIKNFYVSTLNEAYDNKYTPAKTLNEEKELVAKSNADKGGIATMQDKADKENKGDALKKDAPEKEVASVEAKSGVADSQKLGDANKSDDAAAKLKQGHESSETSSGAARGDIAKAQTNADAEHKGSYAAKPAQKEIAQPSAQTGGASNAQSVADTNKSNDASGKLKTSTPKEVEPASDAKKEKAIVVENFGEEETEMPGAGSPVDASATAAGSAEGVPAPPSAGGDETADLDAAASALDALDIKADSAAAAAPVGGAPIGAAPDMSAEVPSGDVPTAGAEAGGDGGAPSVDGAEGGSDDAALKDVEKLVGKTGQKIRSAELSDEMVAGFLKSLITSFDGKLANLDSDIKRELSNKILKAGEEGEVSDGSPESSAPESSTAPKADAGAETSAAPEAGAEGSVEGGEEDVPGDQEIEEAINKHLAEMGMADQGGVGAAPEAGAENPNSFKKYMAERGYEGEGLNEVSIMEMVSLVNGYANECGDDYSKADMQTIAEYMSPEVKQGVTECGYGRFAEGVNVFSIKPKKYKSAEPIVEVAVEEEVEKVDEKKDIGFAPAGDNLLKDEKKEEKAEEKKEEKKDDVSEGTKAKLRTIINNKIQEQLGLKKPSINESAKSAFSKKLDAMIAEEILKGKEALRIKRESGK